MGVWGSNLGGHEPLLSKPRRSFSLGVGAHSWFVRFCQPSVQSPSWSWLPIEEATGWLRHPNLHVATQLLNEAKCSLTELTTRSDFSQLLTVFLLYLRMLWIPCALHGTAYSSV